MREAALPRTQQEPSLAPREPRPPLPPPPPLEAEGGEAPRVTRIPPLPGLHGVHAVGSLAAGGGTRLARPVATSIATRSSAMRPSGFGTSSIRVCSGTSRRGMSRRGVLVK